MSVTQFFTTKDARSVEIIEENLPVRLVEPFLNSLDTWGKDKFRHKSDPENEYQYFALDHMGERANKIIAYGAVYPKRKLLLRLS